MVNFHIQLYQELDDYLLVFRIHYMLNHKYNLKEFH